MADGDAPQRLSGRELAIACWGVGGVLLLVGQATYRLSFLAIEPLVKNMLSSAQLALYVTWVVVNAYGEGTNPPPTPNIPDRMLDKW